MKRKLLAGMLGLFLMIRLIPAFSIFWAEAFSRPILEALTALGGRFPFALLEWLAAAACLVLIAGVFGKKLLKLLSGMILVVLAAGLIVWYPLYFLPQPVCTADTREISLLCENLIDELNADKTDFQVPDDLPAKFIRFPKWMDALDVSGLGSFLTGEALISPELEPISQPFVAVHESMHLQGHAGEGAANIAAWKDCMARGGAYAFSARVWALRYGMGILRRESPSLYEKNILRMNHATLQYYRQSGGAHAPAPQPELLRRLCIFLGIEAQLRDYENLAPYLAAKYPG